VRASALVATDEAERIALRMRNHFGHRVPVEVAGAVSRFRIPAGEFELETVDGSLAVRVESADEAGLARVEEVVSSHLTQFARSTPVELTWTRGSDPLEEAALDWIGPRRNARHLIRTRDWVCALRPHAGPALRLAALVHDAERFAGERTLAEQVTRWEDDDAVREHAERSAVIAAAWLRDEGAREALVAEVAELVRLHESGGTPDADVLQAADSLSVLETNPPARWVADGLSDAENARQKLVRMYERIRLPTARERAALLLERALQQIDEAGA